MNHEPWWQRICIDLMTNRKIASEKRREEKTIDRDRVSLSTDGINKDLAPLLTSSLPNAVMR
jgi:hypothetical protein